jgi:acyl-coenzyme A thioesterase PaaI-like protein
MPERKASQIGNGLTIMKAGKLRFFMNFWPPFLGSGIKLEQMSDDFRHALVSLNAHWYNRNYVGTHFGGSLFSMTDPFYMLMYMQNLGRDYLVWDQEASIRFVSPGRGRVVARFELTDQHLQTATTATANGEKYLAEHVVNVVNADNEVVAEVSKTIYIRRKARAR